MSYLANRLWKEEHGQGMAEYGLILALVAVVAIAAFQLLGNSVRDKVNQVGETINSTS